MSAPRTGADLLCAELLAAGVECVLGVPGTQNVALFEALRRSRLRTIVTTNELAASFMANGYYRASGRVAPVVTIPGPGFTYALTGVAEALHDSAALLHLAGAPPSGTRKFQFQALDQRAIASSLVKAVHRIDRVDQVREEVRAALRAAHEGEPGPVLLEWTEGALGAGADAVDASTPQPVSPRDPPGVEDLVSRLLRARRPVLLVGQGGASSAALVERLAEALPAPVLTTCSGRGVVPEDHRFSLGFDFPRGDLPRLNAFLADSDLVVVLGAKLSSAGTSFFGLALPEDRLVHVDASASVAGATYPASLRVVSPLQPVLERLLAAIGAAGRTSSEWTPERVAKGRGELYSPTGEDAPELAIHGVQPPTAAAFFAAMRRALPREAIVVADSGLHQFLLRRHFEVRSARGLIVPSDFQSIGFALAAAIGARLANPQRPVVAVIGDGGLAASGMEILTAVREKVALTVVVFNDGWLNLIRVAQLAHAGRVLGVELRNPDFEGFAAAMGARYACLDTGDPESVLRAAAGADAVTVVEVRVGDSVGLRTRATRARARGWLADRLGPGAMAWLKGRFGRPRVS